MAVGGGATMPTPSPPKETAVIPSNNTTATLRSDIPLGRELSKSAKSRLITCVKHVFREWQLSLRCVILIANLVNLHVISSDASKKWEIRR